MRILGVETSCDDTGIAILEVDENQNFKILANLVASQIKVHKKYGGVFPAMAKREHQKNLVTVLINALKEAKLLEKEKAKILPIDKNTTIQKILEREPELEKQLIPFLKKYAKPNIDLIAVTNGPGLEPCLWVGVNFAKALSYAWDIPIVAVNHIEAHILINLLNNKIDFPAVALVVSGGHTQLILMKKLPARSGGDYKIIGETRDDAAGECFDKCAKILGLGYPGGPAIAAKAAELKIKNLELKIKLPRPMINSKDYDFSFSGLKTAVLYADKKIKNKTKKYKVEMATEIQQAIIDVLIKKTIKAARDFKVKTIILGGGVSANQELRRQFAEKTKDMFKLIVPPASLSTDNGLMAAITSYFHKNQKTAFKDLEANANLRVE